MDIEKLISPLVAYQFPQFYREEGPDFIAFVQAYYEWMESSGQVLDVSRSMLDYKDVDTTLDSFIKFFKNKYINSLPETIVADKKLLLKHVTDLYNAKGTERGYKLLFRLLFNEDIDLYIPGEHLIRSSDAAWSVPTYIEVSDSPYISSLNGKRIYSSGSGTAVVESTLRKIVQNKTVNLIYISSIDGEFKAGEQILSYDVPTINQNNAPIIVGSLSTITITTGGTNFKVGDLLDVTGSGSGAKAQVLSTDTQNGKVAMYLKNGGFGYTVNAIIQVTGITTLDYSSTSNTFIVGEFVEQSNGTANTANGTVLSINSTAITVGSVTASFVANSTTNQIQGQTSGSNAVITSVNSRAYGVGAGAKVGDLINKQTYQVNDDPISGALLTSLEYSDGHMELGVSSVVGTFAANDVVQSSANITHLDVKYISGEISSGESISNSALNISGITVYTSDRSVLYITGTDANITNANLKPGTILVSNVTNSKVSINSTFPKITVTGNAMINAAASSASLKTVFSNSYGIGTGNTGTRIGYFIPDSTLTNITTGATATITSVTRKTDWDYFPYAGFTLQNLDAQIDTLLNFVNLEVGTIAYLKNINPGTGYSADPSIIAVEPIMHDLQISDGTGGVWGYDAEILGTAGSANGIVTSVKLVDSGFSYNPDESVILSNKDNPTGVTGVSIVETHGVGMGSSLNRSGFLSDDEYIQDSSYYQVYSYEIVAPRMIDSYKKLVESFIHPTGIALYGRYSLKSELVNQNSEAVYITATQTS
ncbi:hypothetical protein UFOVP1071_6 [uncultured Caudovirales phage]|uniref:Baseplate wedge subunit n=1 Tax=uncultured Caudovirales phage TaxID=2100421 RepID=A0A6J5Q8E9_9CAUD|nr:hypothetical protein UFOVP1071_6 [uncultured Caudovirales phage]